MSIVQTLAILSECALIVFGLYCACKICKQDMMHNSQRMDFTNSNKNQTNIVSSIDTHTPHTIPHSYETDPPSYSEVHRRETQGELLNNS